MESDVEEEAVVETPKEEENVFLTLKGIETEIKNGKAQTMTNVTLRLTKTFWRDMTSALQLVNKKFVNVRKLKIVYKEGLSVGNRTAIAETISPKIEEFEVQISDVIFTDIDIQAFCKFVCKNVQIKKFVINGHLGRTSTHALGDYLSIRKEKLDCLKCYLPNSDGTNFGSSMRDVQKFLLSTVLSIRNFQFECKRPMRAAHSDYDEFIAFFLKHRDRFASIDFVGVLSNATAWLRDWIHSILADRKYTIFAIAMLRDPVRNFPMHLCQHIKKFL
jgi:hypothetical protein